MLRIIQSANAAHARSYYTSSSDYYLGNEQELAGQWRGKAAAMLGLQGEVKQAEWDALCDNKHPFTGQRLTARQRSDRTIGYDFNFHATKGLSLLYAYTRDERLLDAFRDSVNATMQDIEQEMQTRVRREGKDENRQTGNFAWGEFIHFTARPIGGVPDPHLHCHAYVFNVTHDPKEEKWKAGQFRELKRDAPYFEALFHSRLAHRLSELGLPIERTKKGWELQGISPEFIRKFSRRTNQIEEKARALGIDNAKAKDGLGAKTREQKQTSLSFADLQENWRDRMSPVERNILTSLEKRMGGNGEPMDNSAAQKSLEYAIGHCFERNSVVPERKFLATAIKHAAGKAKAEDVLRAYERSDLIHGTRKGQRMVTTRAVLEEEQKIVDFARKGRGTRRAYVRKLEHFNREWLNDEQKNAVRHIVESRDRVILVRGKSGVGKTTLLQEAREVIEGAGGKVLAFAPSAKASREVLREADFTNADTVAMLLHDPRIQQEAAGSLILIDEAGQLGTKTLREVFELAENIDARLLLSGDRFQHGSVERGSALRLLEEESGLVPAEVKEIQRQKGAYKEAVKAISEGKVAEGLKRLDDLHWIKEIPGADRYKQIAEVYVESIGQRKSTLLVCPTHLEGERVTAAIRDKLRKNGTLGTKERHFRVLRNAHLTEAEKGDETNYHPGQSVLVFHQNAKGFKRSERLEVTSTQGLPLDQKARFQVFHSSDLSLAEGDLVRITHNGFSLDGKRLNNGNEYRVKAFNQAGDIVLENNAVISKDFGHLDHGYASTSFASQGKSVQRVFVAQGFESLPASSQQQFYVSASRAKERVVFFTENKKDLLDAVSQSDERLSATEFVNRTDHDIVPLRQRQQDRSWERPVEQERKGMTYER